VCHGPHLAGPHCAGPAAHEENKGWRLAWPWAATVLAARGDGAAGQGGPRRGGTLVLGSQMREAHQS
jgi:hypothetical protein